MRVEDALEKKQGYAFMYLEEKFWIDVLRKTLVLTQGNVSQGCEILGIDRRTFMSRCSQYGINVDEYREKEFKVRKNRIEIRKNWKVAITKAFRRTSNVTEAAMILGWNRSTLYQRMGVVGFTKDMYKVRVIEGGNG